MPAVRKTDPSHIMGQGLAMTVDESFREFYLPSKAQIFTKKTYSKIFPFKNFPSTKIFFKISPYKFFFQKNFPLKI